MLKIKVCSNHPCIEGNLKKSIKSVQNVVSSVSSQNFTMQQTVLLLDVMHVRKLKEAISSSFFKCGE